MFSFRDLDSIRRFEVVSSKDVVDVVDTSGSHSDFGEISGPHTPISVLGLILRIVRSINMVMNISESCINYLSLSSHS